MTDEEYMARVIREWSAIDDDPDFFDELNEFLELENEEGRARMTESIHDTSVKVDVFPDEFMPILKIINCAISMPEVFALTEKELIAIIAFRGSFTNLAFEHGV